MVDISRIFDSAKYIIAISLAFNFIAYAIFAGMVLFGLISGRAAGAAMTGLGIAGILAFLLWPINQIINFGIIVYGGYRGAKQGLGKVSCGVIGMMSWGIVAPIIGIIQFIADIIFSIGVQASGILGTAAPGMNAGSLIMQLVCLFGVYLLGFGLNFIVALIGGFIGGAK